MKAHLLFVGIALSTVTAFQAQAEVRTHITALQSVSVDSNGVMEYAYGTGGGCAAHHPEAKVVLDRTGKAQVQVDDVSDKEDICEAFLHERGSLNLKDSLTAALRTAGRTSIQGGVQLPAVQVDSN